LLKQNSSMLTEADSQGQTLFFACVANNQLQVLEWLFERNALGLKSCRSDGRNLMHIAVEKSHVEVVQWLHQKNPSLITQCDQNKLTPLSLAAFNEKIVVLKLSLDMRCKTHKKSHPDILKSISSVIIVTKKLPVSQLQSLQPTYELCVQTLGAEHENVRELEQLVL